MALLVWLLLAAGGLTSLVGWILLVVAAFRQSVGWGLAIVFLGFLVVPVIAFAVKFWPAARPGVLASVAGAVLVTGGWIVGAGALVGAMLTETGEPGLDEAASEIAAGPPAAEGPVDLPQPTPTVAPTPTPTPRLEIDPVEPRPTIGIAPLSAEARAIREHNRRLRDQAWGDEVSWAELAHHIGQTVEVHKVRGDSFRAVLTAADRDSIQLEQRVGGGALKFTLQRDAVRQVRVEK